MSSNLFSWHEPNHRSVKNLPWVTQAGVFSCNERLDYLFSLGLFLLCLEFGDCSEYVVKVGLEDLWLVNCVNELVNGQSIQHHAHDTACSALVDLDNARVQLLANELLLVLLVSLEEDCLLGELRWGLSWLLRDDHLLHDWHHWLLAGNGHHRHHGLSGLHGWLLLAPTEHWERTSIDYWLLVVLSFVDFLCIRGVRINFCCYNKNFEIMLTF